jgi:hypothetical protein
MRHRFVSESTGRPFTAQGYTFRKTVRFSPRGEAIINTLSPSRVGEIGIKPTRGSTVDTNNSNVVAVQFTGIGGKVNIYRR